MDGIQIPRDIADAQGVPDDLDSGQLGPYRFPNPARRSQAAWFYVGGAVLSAIGALAGLPVGMWALTGGLVAIALLHRRAAWNLSIEQQEALARAATLVPFTVGHASAAVGFVGHRSRPVWNIILYSAVEPPDQRALVRLDATTGQAIDETYVENLDPVANGEGSPPL